MNTYIIWSILLVFINIKLVQSASNNNEVLETCLDEKCFKNMLKTKPNLLILFSKSDSEIKNIYSLLKEVNQAVKGVATVAYINCEINKKLCKKLKLNPNSYELKHYNEGTFNKDYDRSISKKSLVNFLNDPKGDMPWEEEESAKDVVHLKNEDSLMKLLKKSKSLLVIFYAPWCGYCKKIKPDYSAAASKLKSFAVLAAMNVDTSQNFKVKQVYNITGFPTLLYFKNGELLFPYGGEFNENGIIEWMQNPQPAKEKEPEKSWADEDNMFVTFLTDDTFDSFIESHTSVLVKFYAPWCGHCKNMKPVLNNVAKRLKEENESGIIAFVDATQEKKLGERFKIKGFPTIKYFKDGKVAWDYTERNEEKIYEFMKNPQEPVQEKVSEWKDELTAVIHAEDSNFASIIKSKKNVLAFFYAPWCGHCKNAKPHLTQAADHFKEDIKTGFVAVDCTKSQAVCEQYNVKGYPTIYHFGNFGKRFQLYEGMREFQDFVKFMSNPTDFKEL